MNHKVTIAIPTYNRKQYLKLAIESCLRQTYENIEILIVDNCSNDGTSKLIESIDDGRIVYYRQKTPVAPIDNWNKCIELATGDHFTFLTDDDLISDDYLELMLKTILEHKDASVVRCGKKMIDSDGQEVETILDLPEVVNIDEYIWRNIRNELFQPVGGVMCATKLIKASGGFVESGLPLTLYADHLLWLKLATNGSVVATVQKHLFFFRVHSNQLANNINIKDFVNNVELYVEKYKNVLSGKDIHPNVLDYINNEFAVSLISHRLQICINRILNGNAIYKRRFIFEIFKLYLRPKIFELNYFLITLLLLADKRLAGASINLLKNIRKYIHMFLPKPVKAVLRPLRRRFG